ncbi:hypothetical protein OVY01_10150 [Robbsia sp. Bb-Pol-6]|uniref:Uncharacterized protein n=1 Tax=Robbsia betulipollinis TaxID=2981849 RepID=A0ABT3ZNQ0_9BURK|nr:hypothetical protein [Robbsia betulipollinis]MCY0387588.1 hypothetical protein [Robbsia betulipollinis]
MQENIHSVLLSRSNEAHYTFNVLADQLVRSFKPSRILVIGEPVGLLIEALWDRGVDTRCECFNSTNIDDVRIDVRNFCTQGLNSAPDMDFQAVVAIDLFQWENNKTREENLEYLKSRSDSIVFVSIDRDDGKPLPGVPVFDWLENLNRDGLSPVTSFDLSFSNADIVHVRQGEPAIGEAHLADFVRMRRVLKALRIAERRLLGLEQEKREYLVMRSEDQRRLAAAEADHAAGHERYVAVESESKVRLESALTALATANDMTMATRADAAVARTELEAIYRSKSWKITAPLRALSGFFTQHAK